MVGVILRFVILVAHTDLSILLNIIIILLSIAVAYTGVVTDAISCNAS
jgi:hypothetical protein